MEDSFTRGYMLSHAVVHQTPNMYFHVQQGPPGGLSGADRHKSPGFTNSLCGEETKC